MLLEARNVTKRFGEMAAVNNLSFTVREGEILGIAGPNGAGKTTLFNVISGVYPAEGKIIFDGQNIAGLGPHHICRRGLARTFQTPVVFSSLSVYDNVKVGVHFGSGASRRQEKEIIDELLDFVGLSAKRDQLARNLPLIDKKLTMVAAALATRPKLLLMDEPLGGLSPAEIKLTIALVEKISQKLGITLLVIEHIMRVLAGISSRLMILHNGEIIATGSPEEVVRDERVIEVYLGGREC